MLQKRADRQQAISNAAAEQQFMPEALWHHFIFFSPF
jgi:hypothetical protein